MIRYTKTALGVLGLCLFTGIGCSNYGKTASNGDVQKADQQHLQHEEVMLAIAEFKKKDPSLQRFFDNCVGYVVLPNVGKGAIGIGGAYGRGELFEGGVMMGYATMKQGTIGVQLGGQSYREVIFFQTKETIERFKQGKMEFSAQASAIAATAGSAATADYRESVAVFTLPKGGLMFEASVGGQKFSYLPR